MVRRKRDHVVQVLRQRLQRALATGGLCAGDRVPSTRDMARELGVDPRLIAVAYRELASEKLVELRARSGIYVHESATAARQSRTPPASMLADALALAVMHGHPGPEVVRALQNVVTRRAIRACIIAPTSDQGLGLARELRDDFGLDASPVLVDRLKGDSIPDSVRRAQLLIGTKANDALVADLAGRLARPHVIIEMRSDLFDREWRLWRNEAVHIVVLDPRFRTMVQRFLAAAADSQRVHLHLATGNLSGIADDAPTYITQAARVHLGKLRAPGMLIPPTRLLAEECIRGLWLVIAELNLAHAERRDAE